MPCACFKAIDRPKPFDVHKGRTTRTPWDPVLVQKTIATSPASQAIPRLIVAGMPGANPCAQRPRPRPDSHRTEQGLEQELEPQLDQARRRRANDVAER